MDKKVKSILNFFEELTQIPRPTRGEAKVAAHIMNWAKSNNFETNMDATGNVFIFIPASKGRENDPIITIQGHMDMVCEKTPESKIDPNTDPLKLLYEGDWLKADGTTLGADNGIAIAYAMQIAVDDEVSKPNIELFFTIAEEDGFDGVRGLKPNTLKGKFLINLDSSREGVFTVASASTQNTEGKLRVKKAAIDASLEVLEVTLDNAVGGHSGIDIAKPRINASVKLFAALKRASKKMNLQLVAFDGGTRRNVIPRKANALVALDSASVDEFKFIMKDCERVIKEENAEEVNLTIIVKQSQSKEALSLEDTKKCLDFIEKLPNGVESWSKDLENTIEASNNIAITRLEDDGLLVFSLQRGATKEGLCRITDKLVSVFSEFNIAAADINVQEDVSTPWSPNPDSELLKRSQKVFKSLFGKEAQVVATHGGLECACIGEKHPEMDMISFGPNIEDLHSPQERINITSIEPVWKLLVGIVESR